MGQSPSTTSTRHDNASTRTLHSTSMHSNRPLSFFRRISNRLSTHPSRRSGLPQQHSWRQQQQQQRQQHPGQRSAATLHTFSTTSSVRQATQEAARAAAAITGPPQHHYLLQTPPHSRSSRRTSVTSLSDSTTSWNELRETTENSNGGGILRYLQIPLRATITTRTLEGDMEPSSTTASLNTTRRMHILVIEYRSNHHDHLPSPTPSASPPSASPPQSASPSLASPPLASQPSPIATGTGTTTSAGGTPQYRFLGLRRRRSQLSSNSSTDTIMSHYPNFNPVNETTSSAGHGGGGQWVVYVMNNSPTVSSSSSSSMLDENPTYEDLLWLSSMMGPVRPCTTTQAAVDAAIPVLDYSEQFKKEELCLVCLDEFQLKQPIRVLKCHHVFHRDCVDRWLCESHNSCPVCRGVPVEPQ